MQNKPIQANLMTVWQDLPWVPKPLLWALLIFLLLVLCSLQANAASHARQPHVDIELIRNSSEPLKPGEAFNLGVLFKLEEGWHIYWQNPGDTGLAPAIEWLLPEGFSAYDIVWPTPSAFPIAHLVNYGYEHEVLLSTKVHVPNDFQTTQAVGITANLSWLVCKEACIPGQATLNLDFPSSNIIGQAQAENQAARFEARRLPRVMKVIGGQVELNESELHFELYAPQLIFKNAKHVEVFVKNLDLVKYSPAKKVEWNNNRLLWKQSRSEFYTHKPDKVDFVVVVDEAEAYDFSMPLK